MHKATIKYKDLFTGEDSLEDMYFHINAFELAEMALDFGGPDKLSAYMKNAFEKEENYEAGFKVLKMFFVRGYGRRLETDGRSRFIKRATWIEELIPSPEFEAFYIKLSTDTKFAVTFWNGLVSEELLAQAAKVQQTEDMKPDVNPAKKKFRDMTLEEQVAAMRAKASANGLELED